MILSRVEGALLRFDKPADSATDCIMGALTAC